MLCLKMYFIIVLHILGDGLDSEEEGEVISTEGLEDGVDSGTGTDGVREDEAEVEEEDGDEEDGDRDLLHLESSSTRRLIRTWRAPRLCLTNN